MDLHLASRATPIVIVVGIILTVSTVSALPTGQVLVVELTETGEPLLRVPVEDSSTIALEYTHSVERSRVLDVYKARNGELVMTRMEFESTGWGLPAQAPVSIENGTFVTTPEWAGPELYVTPGRIAGHELHVDDQTFPLSRLSDGESVRLHLVHRSLVDRLVTTLPT